MKIKLRGVTKHFVGKNEAGGVLGLCGRVSKRFDAAIAEALLGVDADGNPSAFRRGPFIDWKGIRQAFAADVARFLAEGAASYPIRSREP